MLLLRMKMLSFYHITNLNIGKSSLFFVAICQVYYVSRFSISIRGQLRAPGTASLIINKVHRHRVSKTIIFWKRWVSKQRTLLANPPGRVGLRAGELERHVNICAWLIARTARLPAPARPRAWPWNPVDAERTWPLLLAISRDIFILVRTLLRIVV